MNRRWWGPKSLAIASGATFFLATPGSSQAPGLRGLGPRLEPVAETKLIMEGLAQPNLQGIGKLLRARPADVDAWTYARGQALLIAETGNLLMLRPPRNTGQTAWLERAADLRGAASRLARSLARRDYEQSKAGLLEVTNNCNHCHENFRVKTRVSPFADAAAAAE